MAEVYIGISAFQIAEVLFFLENQIKSQIEQIENLISENGLTLDYAELMYQVADLSIHKYKMRKIGLYAVRRARKLVEQFIYDLYKVDVWTLDKLCLVDNLDLKEINLFWNIIKLGSYDIFEYFIYYMERKRSYSKKFYYPRRKTLHVVVEDLQYLEDNPIKFQGVSQPSRTGKSTVCILFLSWIAMKRPNSHSAMGGHSGVLAKGFHKELLTMMTTEEYSFMELFFYWHPEYANKTFPTDKSADDLTITLGDSDRFATITCRGIDGTWTGAIDVSADGYLYVDDLVRDREHSLSPNRMENTFQEYLNKMVDRKNDGAKELMVGTLWNVLDPLERIRKQYEGNPEYRFRKIPALNEDNESNFDYEIGGFSTKYYHEMKERLDDAEWMAKFQQNPYVREGILFQSDELRYFNGILPETDHRIVGVVDVAFGGGDSVSMPIGAEYENGDLYIFDWVFNNGPKEVTIPLVVGKIIGNEIRQTRFEGDRGGDLYCDLVEKELKAQDYKCSCTHKKAPNKMEKKSKIIAYSGDIKRKFIFLQSRLPTQEEKQRDAELGIKRYYRSKEYQKAMDEFTTFVTIGDNPHDDAVDGVTQLEMFIENPSTTATVEAIANPFRGGYRNGGY